MLCRSICCLVVSKLAAGVERFQWLASTRRLLVYHLHTARSAMSHALDLNLYVEAGWSCFNACWPELHSHDLMWLYPLPLPAVLIPVWPLTFSAAAARLRLVHALHLRCSRWAAAVAAAAPAAYCCRRCCCCCGILTATCLPTTAPCTVTRLTIVVSYCNFCGRHIMSWRCSCHDTHTPAMGHKHTNANHQDKTPSSVFAKACCNIKRNSAGVFEPLRCRQGVDVLPVLAAVKG